MSFFNPSPTLLFLLLLVSIIIFLVLSLYTFIKTRRRRQRTDSNPNRNPQHRALEEEEESPARWLLPPPPPPAEEREDEPPAASGGGGGGGSGEEKRRKKKGKKKRQDAEGFGGSLCPCPERDRAAAAAAAECLFPLSWSASSTQRKIKVQYDELVKSNQAKQLTIAQVYKLEAEHKRLEEDTAVYNLLQEQLKLSPAYKTMLEAGAKMEMKGSEDQAIEFCDISFEELLAQEKKDSFWQRNGKLRSSSKK